ncbi:hypothetical protein AURANDRAFT_30024 [Aureococcus anophagefferens]|uniref:Mitochondrial chaperone BCS1 n=1 Tax=Aureococcus anophagefferens TaxID=44056 RepID=F0YFX6_AURAN|nr:hypothetical protein AURANDRAFT_30024 [Aureococcus anophagefferens]EGB06030.1 hypothetical protein AURANDRAFT_30024 [Aureococcus anophagefferens]|eukprot:XP_009039286.1 hypothetical protein AURANDRAFT_30024 [Aureococcus anophagefferens]
MDPLRGDDASAVSAAAPAPQKSFLDGVLPQALQDGPVGAVVAGGAGLAALSLGLGLFRSGSRLAVSGLRRHLTTTLEVTSKDPAYPWVLHWLKEAKGRSNASFKHVSAATIVGDEAGGASFDLVPSPGKHVVRYGGSWLLVERAREYGTVNTSSGTPWEKLTLTAFASPATAAGGLFRELLGDARDGALAAKDEDATILYTCWGTEWRPFGRPRAKRRLESVVLKAGVAESIVGDVEDWGTNAEWYRSRGVPYRRGYLLHGPPGGGKTSFILSLAGRLGLDVCLLALSDEGLSDDRLALALSAVPPRCVVLLEDVDAAFVSRDDATRRPGAAGPSLTLSGLLNALDGAAASEGRVVFMTTNYVDRLDPALLRPGRVDVVSRLGRADADQAARLFASFYDEARGPDADAFGAAVVAASRAAAGRPPSMAELQGFLLTRKFDRAAALADVADIGDVLRVAPPPETPALDDDDDDDEEPLPVKSRGRKRLTALEVDRMVFNPQPGWEDDIGRIK